MLKIFDPYNSSISHEFRLSGIEYDSGWSYLLSSPTQIGYDLQFKMPSDSESFHDGYSVSVYLFKNSLFAQRDIIEVRSHLRKADNGRIGYIVQLNAIFDKNNILPVNKTQRSFFYYALGNIFFNLDFKQTKFPNFSKSLFDITDFFDDDVLILMLCDQYIAEIPGFNIHSYLPSLYQNGFYAIDDSKPSFNNICSQLVNNFNNVRKRKSKGGYFSLDIIPISKDLSTEPFIIDLFRKQLLKDINEETRFLMLYQVIEVLISRILDIELRKTIMTSKFDGFKLKSEIDDIARELTRIKLIFNPYCQVTPVLLEDVKREIYSFLQYLGFSDYVDAYVANNEVFAGIFYDYRNKLLHNHRSFKLNTVNEVHVFEKMKLINSVIELIIIDIITTYSNNRII